MELDASRQLQVAVLSPFADVLVAVSRLNFNPSPRVRSAPVARFCGEGAESCNPAAEHVVLLFSPVHAGLHALYMTES